MDVSPAMSLETPWGAATVPRFLCARDASIYLDDDGLLGDPEGDWGGATNPSVVTPDALRELRCVVIVGEPGAGKSDLLRRHAPLLPDDAAGIPTVTLDLAEYGTEDRLTVALFHAPEVLAWRSDGIGELCVVLDSLDECKERVAHISTVLGAELRRWPVDRLYLRICSRTADWPESLERALYELFPDASVFELLPLRRADVAELAARSGIEADTFLHAVHAARVGAFAAKPLTLALLIRLFARDGRLPANTTALYQDALLLLADEPNATRRDALSGAGASQTPDERLAVACRLAALSVFGQRVAFWTGVAVDAVLTDLSLRDCTGGTEPALGSQVPITEAAVRDALRSGLFTSRGAARVGWAHQTFAEHLAAAFLVVHDPGANTVRDLLVAPDEHVYPQLRPVAAWLMALGAGAYDWIAHQDPELLLTAPVDVPDAAVRREAVAGLFARAATGEYQRRFGQRFGGLGYAGLDADVRAHLFTGTRDERLLAIDLADDCELAALRDDLLRLMLDSAEDYRLRVAASRALVQIKAPPTAAVQALAAAPSGADDPDDELKGHALRLCWPGAMSTADVLAALTPPRHRNLFGAYAAFVQYDLPAGLTSADVVAALDWLLAAERANARSDRADRLADHVAALALDALDDPAVSSRLAQLVLRRAADDQPLFVDTLSRRRAGPRRLTADQRHRLLDAVLPLEDADSAIRLIDWTAYGPGIVTRDDLPWLIDRFTTAASEHRDTLSRLIDWTFHPEIPGHADTVLSLPDDHPVRTEVLRYWLKPVDLDSPEAERLRERSCLVHGNDVDDGGDTPPTDEWVHERITAWLHAFDGGDPAGFWQACYFLYLRPGASHFFVSDELDPDLTAQPRWGTLPAPLRERFVNAAKPYLDQARCDPDAWLGSNTVHRPAYAGLRALVLLLRHDPAAISALDGAVWREWAPIITAFPAAHGAASWDDKRELLTRAATAAPGVVFNVITRLIGAASDAGESLSLDRELELVWSPRLSGRLHDALTGGQLADATAIDVGRVLAKRDPDTARPLLHATLTGSGDDDERTRAGSLLLAYDAADSWQVLSDALTRCPEFGERLILSFVNSYSHHGPPNLDDAALADLYIWLAHRFPVEDDPQHDDAHWVGPREQAGQWRDGILRALQARGAPSAVAAIRRIEFALPQYQWLRRTRREAELQTRANTCTPVAPRDLLAAVTASGRRLVNSDVQLLEVVLDALTVIQQRLTGETPEAHLLWDTRSGRPKQEDDISDYLLNRLRDLLAGRGVVVNREVQVRRSGAGIGERTDLRIDAAPSGATAENPTITLAIEVKGAWNRELLTAVRSQLVDRYMRDLNIHRGVYLVAWPDLESWTSDDADRRSVERRPREQMHRDLVTHATTLAAEGYDIRVVALDISYRRPPA